MSPIPRRVFTEEFKREAIKLVLAQGLTVAEASRKLDVATKSLRTWIRQQEHGEQARLHRPVDVKMIACWLPSRQHINAVAEPMARRRSKTNWPIKVLPWD